VPVGVIIVAAGRGSRLGGNRPKQLLDLGGRTILERSVSAFNRDDIGTRVVVLPAELVADGAAYVARDARSCLFVAGGDRRQDSVRCGLAAMPSEIDIVLVHDAARPFVDHAVIDRVIQAVPETGAVVPCVLARDTLKQVSIGARTVTRTIDRREVWLAQTPQGFSRSVLERAVETGRGAAESTDEAMLAEQNGTTVVVVPGDDRNIKITTAEDLAYARRLVELAPRVGTGYDLHRLVEGRPLVLAGVLVDSARGPDGHSDGDVVCHAVVDALLGAAALGDIGQHFSNTDPRWKDAPGLDLVARTMAMLDAAAWAPSSVDVTVILERPKLAPHLPAVRAALAEVLDLDSSRVSVKAKTNEGVDATGRGEAIASHAVAVLVIRGQA
jgi:2-C-methyl-D-erythritol 4-phosphate cytidylyltransferase/2-C-methyl-D-erythritol 2,4-cyclodiphosphate synthase